MKTIVFVSKTQYMFVLNLINENVVTNNNYNTRYCSVPQIWNLGLAMVLLELTEQSIYKAKLESRISSSSSSNRSITTTSATTSISSKKYWQQQW